MSIINFIELLLPAGLGGLFSITVPEKLILEGSFSAKITSSEIAVKLIFVPIGVEESSGVSDFTLNVLSFSIFTACNSLFL